MIRCVKEPLHADARDKAMQMPPRAQTRPMGNASTGHLMKRDPAQDAGAEVAALMRWREDDQGNLMLYTSNNQPFCPPPLLATHLRNGLMR